MLTVACAQSPQEQYRLLGGHMGRKLVPGGACGLGGDLAVCFDEVIGLGVMILVF